MWESNTNKVQYNKTDGTAPVSTNYDTGIPIKGHSGASSIELSRDIASLVVPFPYSPILMVPITNNIEEDKMVLTAISSDAMRKFQLDMDKIAQGVLDAWAKNIQENAKRVREWYNSPEYRHQHEMLVLQHVGSVHPNLKIETSRVDELAPHASHTSPVKVLNNFDNLNVLTRVPGIDNTGSSSQDTVVVPVTALMIVGGVLTLGVEETVTAAASSSGALTTTPLVAVEKLQTLNLLNPSDIIPMINLLVAAPIYTNSWNEAISRFGSKERVSLKAVILNFAKDVLKMVTDPEFISSILVSSTTETTPEKSQARKQFVATVKLVLLSVALSLLYSQSVGKVQGGKFWGMEPEEFKGLLTGDIPEPKITSKSSVSDKLTVQIINLIKAQLNDLPAGERANVIGGILNYISGSKDVKSITQPLYVFENFFAGYNNDMEEKKSLLQPI